MMSHLRQNFLDNKRFNERPDTNLISFGKPLSIYSSVCPPLVITL